MRTEINVETGKITELEDTPIIKPTKEEILNQKINEALAYLAKTNHKFFIGYIPKENEDLKAIQAKRDESLLFIRDNS
jgi:hypothetical protein